MKGKQRPRVVSRGGFASTYTPEQTVSAENWVRQCAISQVGQLMLEGPLAVELRVVVGIPASWPKKRQQAALTMSETPTGKPDLDNVVKLVCDALNGVMWKDDSQIIAMTVTKRYGEKPGSELYIRTRDT